jgi:hypothetical protein
VCGFNLPTQGVFFNHPLVWHIGVCTHIEYDTPEMIAQKYQDLKEAVAMVLAKF